MPTLPITLVIDTPEKLEAIQCAFEYSRDSVAEVFNDGSGQPTPIDQAHRDLAEQVGV